MPRKFYDVVVIGRSLGALAAAALLARRDFTVLVLGQGRAPAEYPVLGRKLRRRAFTMLAGRAPVWARIMRELAQTQTWRRRAEAIDPTLQFLLGDRRIDVPPDADRFAREIERELPEAQRFVADLYADLARVTAAADACFEKEAVWPPGTFFERRETSKVISRLPYASAEPHADLLADFPRDHIYRRVVAESVRFASDLATAPPAFAVARLHGAWTRGVSALPGGEQELDDRLCERIVADGGELCPSDRVTGLSVRRGAVDGVTVDVDARMVGAGFVIADATGEDLANWSGGEGIKKRAQRDWPRIMPAAGRFVVSLVARREGIPEALGKEALILPGSELARERPMAIHLQRCGERDGEELLCAEMLVGERDAVALTSARERVLQRICSELPFLDRHLVLVDSVHDGLPVWHYRAGRRHEIDRAEIAAAARAEPMERLIEVDPPGFLGLAGEPLRGPIKRTLLCGKSVMPGLGQEGQLLAAWSAARLVTRSDRRKARMRREVWTKLEIE